MRAMKTTRAAILLVLLAGLLTVTAGCGKVPQTHFYTLEPASPGNLGKTLPYEVAVSRFRAAYRLSQDRVAFMESSHHVDYYNYHRWAGFPADLVTSAFITGLKRAGLFRADTEMRSGARPDYILRGEIQDLQE